MLLRGNKSIYRILTGAAVRRIRHLGYVAANHKMQQLGSASTRLSVSKQRLNNPDVHISALSFFSAPFNIGKKLAVYRQSDYRELRTTMSFKKGDAVIDLQADGEIVMQPSKTSIEIGPNEHAENIYGQYVNHSHQPNCQVIAGQLVALSSIDRNEAITIDYLHSESQMNTPFFDQQTGEFLAGKDKTALTEDDLASIDAALTLFFKDPDHPPPDFSYFVATSDKVKAQIIELCNRHYLAATLDIDRYQLCPSVDLEQQMLDDEDRLYLTFKGGKLHYKVFSNGFTIGGTITANQLDLTNLGNGLESLQQFLNHDDNKQNILNITASRGHTHIKRVNLPPLEDADAELLKKTKETKIKLEFYAHRYTEKLDFNAYCQRLGIIDPTVAIPPPTPTLTPGF